STTVPILLVDQVPYQPTGVVVGNEQGDTVPPEVNIQFNPQTRSFNILGTDNLGIVQTINQSDSSRLFKDLADNITQLQFNSSSFKEINNINLKSIAY